MGGGHGSAMKRKGRATEVPANTQANHNANAQPHDNRTADRTAGQRPSSLMPELTKAQPKPEGHPREAQAHPRETGAKPERRPKQARGQHDGKTKNARGKTEEPHGDARGVPEGSPQEARRMRKGSARYHKGCP